MKKFLLPTIITLILPQFALACGGVAQFEIAMMGFAMFTPIFFSVLAYFRFTKKGQGNPVLKAWRRAFIIAFLASLMPLAYLIFEMRYTTCGGL